MSRQENQGSPLPERTRAYIGIDPGSDGAICLMPPVGEIRFFPLKDSDPHDTAAFIADALNEFGSLTAAIEEVHAMPRDGGRQAFTFGFNTGLLHGVLTALCVPYVTVPPQEWQKEIWVTGDKVYKTVTQKYKDGTEKTVRKTDPKPTSLTAARRLFPHTDLRRNPRCKVPHDGMTDALLIAEHARRRNL